MASDQILKRTVFGGFKRENVIDYIEQLQLQLSETQNLAEDYKKKYQSIKKKSDALMNCQDRIDVLSSENELLKNKIEELKSDIIDSSAVYNSEEIKSIIYDTKQNRIEITELIKQLSESVNPESAEYFLTKQLFDNTNRLIKTLNKIDCGYETDDIENENQFRFDIDGLEKVEEEFLNKMFLDE